MFTIDRLAKLDAVAIRAFTAVRKGVDWLGDQYETRLVKAAYRVVEAKSAAIAKVEAKINELDDAKAALRAESAEAVAVLQAKHRAELAALAEELADREDALAADLAQAAQSLVAAGKDYDATVRDAAEKLGVEVAA